MDKVKIMFVDDERDILDMFEMFFSDDYDVITAENGIKAMEFFLLENPSIIITDINMPYMSGMELARKLKIISPSTKIIFMTGNSCPDIFEEAQKLGVFKYLYKPVSLVVIKKLLQDIVIKVNSRLCLC